MYSLKFFQNIETSKNLKYSEKETNKFIVAKMTPPPNNNTDTFGRSQRNPIRHYRKQITGNNNSRLLINPLFNVPSSNIVKSKDQDCPDCAGNNVLFFNEEIYPNNAQKECLIDCSGYQSHDPTLWKYSCSTPSNNVIKSANTNLSKKYSNSNRDYLKNRAKTYKTNLHSEITNSSNNCEICNINNVNNNGVANVSNSGNVNNSIGGTSMSSYIHKRSFRDINENSISNNSINNTNKLCCPSYPNKILYKKNFNNCKVNNYPNLSRHAILCRTR